MLEAEKDLRRGAAEPRDPVRTRQRLLQAAFQEVYHSGFQGSDLETILDRAGVTKGALYHHFENKEALGYAVVDEVITTMMRDKWLRPLEHAKNPIDALARIVRSTSTKPEWLRRGCPINNLALEMSPLDEGFRKRLANVFSGWHDGIAAALREGQKRGLVRSDVDPNERAIFLVAVYEGYLSLAKNSQDARVLRAGKRILILHLESLRRSAGQNRAPSPRQSSFLRNEHTNGSVPKLSKIKSGSRTRPRAEDRLCVWRKNPIQRRNHHGLSHTKIPPQR